MNGCDRYRQQISLLLDGELSAEEKDELARHVTECEECRALYCAFRSVSELIEEDMEEPPAALLADTMAKVRRSILREKNRRAGQRWKGVLAVACSLALVVAAAGLLLPKLKKSADAGAGNLIPYSVAAVAAPAAADNGELFETAAAPTAEEESNPLFDPEPTPVDVRTLGEESTTPTVNLIGRGLGSKLQSYFSGGECDMPQNVAADRSLFLYYDLDGVNGEVLIRVFGQRVYYMQLSGEETTARLATCGWNELSALIYG